MSLQGSLDSFPLPDVLALLASTKKTGELRVAGARGSGRVFFADGQLVGIEAGEDGSAADSLFQLLRVDQGAFTFDAGAAVPEGRPMALEAVLADAQTQLAEWHVIEAVVPSLATAVRLSEELPSPKVSVSASQWRVLRTVAAGGSVAAVARAMGLGEFGACQAVKRLVDAGLVEVDGVPEVTREEPQAEPQEEPAPAPAPDLDELVSIPAHMRRARRVDAEPEPEPVPRSRLAEAASRRREEAREDDLVGAAAAALTPENADAFVRELSDLGTDPTEAAEAVEAAARAVTTEERAAALESVLTNEQGEPLNRGLLLKFLSSVRS